MLTLKKDKSGIKKVNSIAIFVAIIVVSGLVVYQMGRNKVVIYTVLALVVLFVLSFLVAVFIRKMSKNADKVVPFVMQVNDDELRYYPINDSSIVYDIVLKEIKVIHILWWGNGSNRVTIEFLGQPNRSSRIEADEKKVIEKTKLSFERLDVSYKDFHQFFNAMNDSVSFPIIFDKR